MNSLKSSQPVNRKSALVPTLLSIAVLTLFCTSTALAQTLTTLATFNRLNGQIPDSRLIADGNGNLFGTTTFGGLQSFGVVWEITR